MDEVAITTLIILGVMIVIAIIIVVTLYNTPPDPGPPKAKDSPAPNNTLARKNILTPWKNHQITLPPQFNNLPSIQSKKIIQPKYFIPTMPTIDVSSDDSEYESETEDYSEREDVYSDITDDESSDEEISYPQSSRWFQLPGGGYFINHKFQIEKVVDVVEYPQNSGNLLYLYKSNDRGMIISSHRSEVVVEDDIKGLFVWNKRLGIFSNQRIKVLSSKTGNFKSLGNEIERITQEIKWVSTTLDHKNLIIQIAKNSKDDSLLIFDTEGNEIEKISIYPSSKRRVYGTNLRTYIDVDTSNHIVTHSNGFSLDNVLDATLNWNGNIAPLTLIRSKDYQVDRIKFLKSKVFYF